MAFKFVQHDVAERWVQTEESLWLTAGRDRVVAAEDPEAAFLLASPGKRIRREEAIRYGLVKPDKTDKETAAAAEDEAQEPERQTVDEILDAVGDDPDKARSALDAEARSGSPRKTLMAKLEQLAGGGTTQ